MTFEARLGFIIFFFVLWSLSALLPWAAVAIANRGRGALPALPLAIAAACAGGIVVPAVGLRDFGGFLLSLGTAPAAALAASLLTTRAVRSFEASRPKRAPTRTPPITRRPPLDPPPPSR